MDRRTMLGRAASLGLLVAAHDSVGQRPVKSFRIGYLSLRAAPNAWDEAFVQRLRELGYRHDDNLLIDSLAQPLRASHARGPVTHS
jgi:hypothetical protein